MLLLYTFPLLGAWNRLGCLTYSVRKTGTGTFFKSTCLNPCLGFSSLYVPVQTWVCWLRVAFGDDNAVLIADYLYRYPTYTDLSVLVRVAYGDYQYQYIQTWVCWREWHMVQCW
jgi:hypothetical protein